MMGKEMTTTAYDRLTDVLADAIDEGWSARQAAFRALAALREPDPTVLQRGVQSQQWTAAVDALLKAAAEVDAAELAPVLAERQAAWPAFRRELEALGCHFKNSDVDGQAWEIEGPGARVELNLATGNLVRDDGMPEQFSTFDHLARHVKRRIADKQQRDSDNARRKELRKSHTWNNGLKAWVPTAQGAT
jgi:hypothetical protein